MISDETEHAQLLIDFLKNKFNRDVLPHDLVRTEKRTLDSLRDYSLTQLLSKYYIGECCIWTGLYLTYKNCLDNQTTNILHRLVVDESHHYNNIFKMYQKLFKSNSIELDNNRYISYVTELRYFGLGSVKGFFKLNNETSRHSKSVLNLIYNHDWQSQFNLIFLKKTFKLYSMFNPECDWESYRSIINKDVLTMN
jgi:hypothetical protein